MGIKTLLKNLKTLSRSTVPGSEDRFWQNVIGDQGVSGRLNIPGIARPAESVLMVYGCLITRREAIGSVPLRMSDSNDNLVEAGPFFDLLSRPRPGLTWGQYVRQLETYLTLYDRIYIAKVGEPGREPDELVPLSPLFMTPEIGVHVPTGTPVVMKWHYLDPVTGVQKDYLPEDLIIHQGFNPHAPLASLDPMNILKRTMQAEIAAREQNLALFANGAKPQIVWESEHNVTKEQATEAMETLNSRLRGINNSHKSIVAWGGLKAKELGLTPAEMEYINGLKFLRSDYYIVLRVKPAMVGEMMPTGLGQGNESTDAQKVQWWEEVGFSELALIAQLHQIALAPLFKNVTGNRKMSRREIIRRNDFFSRATSKQSGNIFLWFDENAIPALVRARLARADQFAKFIAAGYRPDDINDYLDLGLPQHPDNLGRVPFSQSAIGPDAPAAPEPAAQDGKSRSLKLLDDLSGAIHEVARAETAKYQTIKKTFDRFVATREKAAAKRWSRFFLEQRERVLMKAGKMRIQRSEAERANADELLKQIFPKNDENGYLVARLAPLWAENLKDGWSFFNEETATAEKANPFEVSDPHIVAALKEREIQGLKVNDTTEDKLRDILAKGIEDGLSTAQIGDNIAEYYSTQCVGEEAFRPATAARTQVSGLVNEGRMLAANEVGGLLKGWLHGGSKEPRAEHIQAQETYLASPIPLDQPFIVAGYECDAPGSTELPVEEVANCSCMVVFSKG